MGHGPVLSQTYNLIAAEPYPSAASSYWHRVISRPENYEVALLDSAVSTSALALAQLDIIDTVYAQFGRKGRWELVDSVRTLPEWENPPGSSIPISLRDILTGGALDEKDAEAVEEGLRAESALDDLLTRRRSATVRFIRAGRAIRIQDRRMGTHLWFVLTDPDADSGLVILVALVTERAHTDRTVRLDLGDHPLVVHLSNVECRSRNGEVRSSREVGRPSWTWRRGARRGHERIVDGLFPLAARSTWRRPVEDRIEFTR